MGTDSGDYATPFEHLRSLPDGSLTRTEVAVLLDNLRVAQRRVEVYQRALYEALTRADDDIPEWVHLIHSLGVATVMDPDHFGSRGGTADRHEQEG